MKNQSLFMRFVRGGWRVIDTFRRLLHLFVLLFVLALLIAVTSTEPVFVPASAALVIAPGGAVVDQLSGDPLDRALAELRGDTQREILLRDLIEAIRLGADDDRIKALYLRLDGLQSSGLSKAAGTRCCNPAI